MWDCALLFLLAGIAAVLFGLLSDAGIASLSAAFVAKLCLFLFIFCFATGLIRAHRRARSSTRTSRTRSRVAERNRA